MPYRHCISKFLMKRLSNLISENKVPADTTVIFDTSLYVIKNTDAGRYLIRLIVYLASQALMQKNILK